MFVMIGIITYFILAVLVILATLFTFYYIHLSYIYNYWKERGIPYIKPSFPFGNLGDVLMGRKSLIDLTIEQYRQFEGQRFFGIFNFNKPILVLRDPSLIERVLMTDFTNFCNKVEGDANNGNFLASYLSNLQGDTWRQVRQKLNGAFSHTKLKQMTDQISTCADLFIEKIDESSDKKEPALADCLGYLFSQRVISSCVFGIQCDNEGIKEFILHVKMLILKMKVVHLIILWPLYVPSCIQLLYCLPSVQKVVQYFKNLTSASIKIRKDTHIKRKDFLQILLDMKEEETIENNSKEQLNNDLSIKSDSSKKVQLRKWSFPEKEQILSDDFIASTLFIFMSLGMESTAVAIAFLLYDLAANPDVQRNVQTEVDAVVDKFGEFNYEAVQQLHYLDSVIQESARIRPGFAYTTRVCQAPYKMPGSDFVLDKGITVLIPTCAVHLDPQYYDDPEQFNPSRFRDNHYKPSPTFLTFGAGPRMCIAIKLVILELKLAIAKLMQKYSLALNSKTQLPIRYASTFSPKILNGIWLDFEARRKTQSQ